VIGIVSVASTGRIVGAVAVGDLEGQCVEAEVAVGRRVDESLLVR
jgi:hypothetical protein